MDYANSWVVPKRRKVTTRQTANWAGRPVAAAIRSFGCGGLRVVIGGRVVSCIDGASDEIDDITAVQSVQSKYSQ